MNIRKPLKLDQLKLVIAIQKLIGKQNPNLAFEFDLTMMNPVINGVNQMIDELNLQGDCLFTCECIDVHDDECDLKGCLTYDPVVKFKAQWVHLNSYIQRHDTGFSYSELMKATRGNTGIFKALLTKALTINLLYRDKDELFYKVKQ